MTKKIVINRRFGGFSLSHDAVVRYHELKGNNIVMEYDDKFHFFSYYMNEKTEDNYWNAHDIPRDDPTLIQVIEELGEGADGDYAELKIVEIPDDVEWYIDDYDGIESVNERHRSWF